MSDKPLDTDKANRNDIKHRLIMASDMTIEEDDLERMVTSILNWHESKTSNLLIIGKIEELDRFRSIPIEKISTAVANHVSQRYKSLEQQLTKRG